MTWTILVLILGIALYVFNGKLVKQDPKKASAKSEYMKKAVNVVAALLMAGAVCRLFVPYYLTSVNPAIIQEMVTAMQEQQNEENWDNNVTGRQLRSHASGYRVK